MELFVDDDDLNMQKASNERLPVASFNEDARKFYSALL